MLSINVNPISISSDAIKCMVSMAVHGIDWSKINIKRPFRIVFNVSPDSWEVAPEMFIDQQNDIVNFYCLFHQCSLIQDGDSDSHGDGDNDDLMDEIINEPPMTYVPTPVSRLEGIDFAVLKDPELDDDRICSHS